MTSATETNTLTFVELHRLQHHRAMEDGENCWFGDMAMRTELDRHEQHIARAVADRRAWRAYQMRTGCSWDELCALRDRRFVPPPSPLRYRLLERVLPFLALLWTAKLIWDFASVIRPLLSR